MPPMGDHLLSLLIFAFLLFPGAWFFFGLLPKSWDGSSRRFLALMLSLVLLVYLGWIASALFGLGDTSIWVVTLLYGLTTAGAALWRRHRQGLRWPHFQFPGRGTLLLALILLLVGLARGIPALFSEVPLGWDTSFHLLLSRGIELTGVMPATLEPFERFATNYPWGSHLFVYWVAKLGSVPMHHVFSMLITSGLGLFSTYGIYVLGRKLFGRSVALGGAFVYGLLTWWGSLGYYIWGGLPNQFGMLVFLGVFLTALLPEADWKRRFLIAAPLMAGVCLIHHHVMITGFAILALMGLLRMIGERRFKSREGLLLLSLIPIALILTLPFSGPLLARLVDIGQSQVATYYERLDILTDAFLKPGVLLIIFAMMGLGLVLSRRANGPPETTYLWSWIAGLLLLFALFHYGWGIYSQLRFNRRAALFTPSRFITDMVYPLSVVAGVGLARVLALTRKHSWFFALLLVTGLLCVTVHYAKRNCRKWQYDLRMGEVLDWARVKLPRQAFIFNSPLHGHIWSPYFSGREVSHLDPPSSEIPDGWWRLKRRLPRMLQRNWRGRLWSRFKEEERKLLKKNLGGRPLYWFIRGHRPPLLSARALHRRGPYVLYKLPPAARLFGWEG